MRTPFALLTLSQFSGWPASPHPANSLGERLQMRTLQSAKLAAEMRACGSSGAGRLADMREEQHQRRGRHAVDAGGLRERGGAMAFELLAHLV